MESSLINYKDRSSYLEENLKPDYTFKQFLKYIGPGFLICIAYLDPGNLASDLKVGRDSGYKLLWLLFLSTFLGLLF